MKKFWSSLLDKSTNSLSSGEGDNAMVILEVSDVNKGEVVAMVVSNPPKSELKS